MQLRSRRAPRLPWQALAHSLAFVAVALLAAGAVTCALGDEPECRLPRPRPPVGAVASEPLEVALPGLFPHLMDDAPEISIETFAGAIEGAVVHAGGLPDIPAFKHLLLEGRSEPRALFVLPASGEPVPAALAAAAEVCKEPRRTCVLFEPAREVTGASRGVSAELRSLEVPAFTAPRGSLERIPAGVDRDRLGTTTGQGLYVFAPGGELIWFCPLEELPRAVPTLAAVLAALGGVVEPALPALGEEVTEPPRAAPAPALNTCLDG